MWCIHQEFTDRRTFYYVESKCGYRGTRRKDHVLSGRTVSCKSFASKITAKNHPPPAPIYKGCGDLGRTFWGHIKSTAKKRGISFDITIEYAWDLFLKQNKKCALSGVEITLTKKTHKCNPDYKNFTASLDRIDSTKPYFEGNVQWVHKEINYIKRDLTDEEFVTWCKLVSQNKGGS